VMAVWAWVRRRDRSQRVLPTWNGLVPGTSLPLIVRDDAPQEWLPYDRDVCCERMYYMPLERILQGSRKDAEERLVAMMRAVAGHLRKDINAAV